MTLVHCKSYGGALMRFELLRSVLGFRRRVANPPSRALSSSAVFLVTSTLAPSTKPLSYSSVRSIYGADERLEQTCVGLDSVRERVPGAFVVLLESSTVTGRAADELARRVDWLISFDADPLAAALRDGVFKGAAEAFMLASAMMALRKTDYPVLLKLSGRYKLSNRFDLGSFPKSGFGVHFSGGAPSTRLYSVAKDSEQSYVRQLRCALWLTSKGLSIEQTLFERVPARAVHSMRVVGVTGLVAVSGMAIDE
jgi:hypothetical protein